MSPSLRQSARGPVFVDDSGRRHRWARRAGVTIVALGATYAAVLVVAALIGIPLNAPGLPFLTQHHATAEHSPAAPRHATDEPVGSSVPAESATSAVPSPTGRPTHSTPSASPSAATLLRTTHPTPTSAATTHTARSVVRSKATATPTAHPTQAATQSTSHPTAHPTTAHTHSTTRGKSATAPGASRRPIH